MMAPTPDEEAEAQRGQSDPSPFPRCLSAPTHPLTPQDQDRAWHLLGGDRLSRNWSEFSVTGTFLSLRRCPTLQALSSGTLRRLSSHCVFGQWFLSLAQEGLTATDATSL